MAKILTTKGSAAELEDLIRRAEKELYIISFSFIISDPFIIRFKQASDRGVLINLIYGKSIREDSLAKLEGIANLKIYYLENLHAKIFANESKCIIGSMNFSEASEINNTELGVLLSSTNDDEAFKDAIEHCKEILTYSRLIRSTTIKSNYTVAINEKKVAESQSNYWESKKTDTLKGYCIRTGKEIPLNHEKPFSKSAYDSWAVYEDEYYAEKYDHLTGERSNGETSMATPILKKNWKKYKDLVGL